MNGIASVQKNGPDPDRYQCKEPKNGKHQLVLKAANNRVIGTGQLRDSEKGMMTCMKSFQQNAAKAKVADLTKV